MLEAAWFDTGYAARDIPRRYLAIQKILAGARRKIAAGRKMVKENLLNSTYGKADLSIDLSKNQLRDMRRAVDAVWSGAACFHVTGVTLNQLVLTDEMLRLADSIHNQVAGELGVALLRGIPIDSHLVKTELWLWILGLLLGRAVSQSRMGDRIGHVTASAVASEEERGYRSRKELSFHTDSDDMVVCLCVRKALSGGVSRFVSVAAVYDTIARTQPQHLLILEKGFYYHQRGEGPLGAPLITPYRIPVIKSTRGLIGCVFLRDQIELAASESGQQLTNVEVAALDAFERTASAPSLVCEMTLEPGELYILNNWTILHSRSSFVDHADPNLNRLLLRLWIKDPNGGRAIAASHRRFYQDDGIEHVPNGTTIFRSERDISG